MKRYVRILLIVAGFLLGAGDAGAVDYTTVAPLGMVIVTVDRPSREQFFEKLKEFAGENEFTCGIDVVPPDKESFIIQMYRRDMMIMGTNWPDDLAEFHLGFYKNDHVSHLEPLPQAKVDAVMAALQESLRHLKGVTSEIRPR